MAKSKKISLKELSDDELYEKIDADKLQLKKARFNHAVSLLENPNVLGLLRKEIARSKTEARSRELAAQ